MRDEDSPAVILYPSWQGVYRTAILETNIARLPQRVADAEAAIAKRLQTISMGADHRAESHAIEDALAALRILKQEL